MKNVTAQQASTKTKVTKVAFPFPKNELDIADLVIHEQGHNLLYCADDGCFYIWNGQQWEQDARDFGRTHKLVKKIIRGLLVSASKILDDSQSEKSAKFAAYAQTKKMIDAVEALIKADVLVKLVDFDSDPWLFNVANGTIDLHTGALLAHDRAHRITKMSKIVFDTKSKAPMWNDFLQQIFGSEELIQFVQRAVGYTMAGVVHEKKSFFIAHGLKNTGKSTFINTLIDIFSDHQHTLDVDSLMQKQGGGSGISNDIAALCGKRFVTSQESEKGQRLKEGMIKQWTGRDKISARFLHREFFDFTPTFKVWLSTNNRPGISSDDAVWARINLIPFTHQFTADEIQGSLKKLGCAYEKYLTDNELSGILNWCLAGCASWQHDGLGTSPEVDAANAEYRNDMDTIGNFLRDYIAEINDTQNIGIQELYTAYQNWSESTGQHALKKPNFEQEVRNYQIDGISAGFTIVIGHHRYRYWQGLGKLKSQPVATPTPDYTQNAVKMTIITPTQSQSDETPVTQYVPLQCPSCHFEHTAFAISQDRKSFECKSCRCQFDSNYQLVSTFGNGAR